MVDREGRKVRRMFGEIAHRYDFLNHFLSLSIDRHWRNVVRRRLKPHLNGGGLVLDLCTGTCDLAIEMSKSGPVVGCDFCHPMLTLGLSKLRARGLEGRVRLVEGDALELPFPSGAFDVVTIAFGLRNLEDYGAGLREMHRVLNPSGTLGVLEFSQPRWPVFGSLYRFYFKRVLPRLGRLLSGREGPYSYLPASVDQFPGPEALSDLLKRSGFARVERYSLTGGVAMLHLAHKSEVDSTTD